MDKFELLSTFCESAISRPEESRPVIIPWSDQSRLLWPEAQYFAPWRDVAYASASERAADNAIQDRVRLRRWKRVSPEIGRVLGSRLTQALAVIQVNEMAGERAGTPFPSGLDDKALTSVLLIYWCYAMELPLAESGGATAGRA
ncbi:hypothetical protein QOZ96_001816 [Brevundimonas nasdae]|uniref:hypothetical protein n=1 Tax=Brevundimonas TaxID=41275 RepID=UPI0019127B5A|nr:MULTISPECIES: hypothetical protein [Brevundimonas]MBK6025351.1 hypothetical protein [Brevundimonas nasdae]MDQ0451867.1 hypothetical protein [Brevundimonas nasdae]